MPDRTRPYVPSGYYLWIARKGTKRTEARFGSSQEKTYIDFEGEVYVPQGDRLQKKSMRREERLSFDPRSNLFAMVTIARDGVPPTEDEVKSWAVRWEEVLNVPMVVRVDNDPYHPKTGDGDARDESVTYYATRQRGAPQGWPAGVPLPQGVLVRNRAEAPPPEPEQPPQRQAPAQQQRPTPIRASDPAVMRNRVPAEPPPARRQHPTPRRDELPESWHQLRRTVANQLSTALEKFGWIAPRKAGDPTPTADELAAAEGAVERFWQYFDGVPALARLKHVKADGSAQLYWTPEQGATEDALALAAEALSRFNQGQDVRPPMPGKDSKR